MSSEFPQVSLHRYGGCLYGDHPRFENKTVFFLKKTTGDLIPGGFCTRPSQARPIDAQSLSSADRRTIFNTLSQVS